MFLIYSESGRQIAGRRLSCPLHVDCSGLGMGLDRGLNLLGLLGPTSVFGILHLSPHDRLHLVFLKQTTLRVMAVCCGERVDRLLQAMLKKGVVREGHG